MLKSSSITLTTLLQQHFNLGGAMILTIIEIAAGLALFYGTGVAIAKTVMYFNPDPPLTEE